MNAPLEDQSGVVLIGMGERSTPSCTWTAC